MKWWGWGDPEYRLELPDSAIGMLRNELGVEAGDATEHVELAAMELPEPRPLPEAVRAATGETNVLTDAEQRLRRSAGRGYPDLVRLRRGKLEAAPDAVLVPADAGRVGAVLEACASSDVAVVPFGGGTSVVGGVEPERGTHGAVVALDLSWVLACAARMPKRRWPGSG